MTFTYVGTLTTDLDKVRFTLQDTVEGAGVRPNGGNFSDEELNGLLAREGTVEKAVASAYEALANAWANYVDTQVGARREALSKIADRYKDLASEWRSNYGYTGSTLRSGFVTRKDGYSQNIDAGED